MAYTAEDVKRLREATAAGMLDCKKALDEANGDYCLLYTSDAADD